MNSRRTTVIAEIGENHVGDWDRARRMVREAAGAGADIVKFQSYKGEDVAPGDPEKEWFTRVSLPDRQHVHPRLGAAQPARVRDLQREVIVARLWRHERRRRPLRRRAEIHGQAR